MTNIGLRIGQALVILGRSNIKRYLQRVLDTPRIWVQAETIMVEKLGMTTSLATAVCDAVRLLVQQAIAEA